MMGSVSFLMKFKVFGIVVKHVFLCLICLLNRKGEVKLKKPLLIKIRSPNNVKVMISFV